MSDKVSRSLRPLDEDSSQNRLDEGFPALESNKNLHKNLPNAGKPKKSPKSTPVSSIAGSTNTIASSSDSKKTDKSAQ